MSIPQMEGLSSPSLWRSNFLYSKAAVPYLIEPSSAILKVFLLLYWCHPLEYLFVWSLTFDLSDEDSFVTRISGILKPHHQLQGPVLIMWSLWGPYSSLSYFMLAKSKLLTMFYSWHEALTLALNTSAVVQRTRQSMHMFFLQHAEILRNIKKWTLVKSKETMWKGKYRSTKITN